MNHLFFKNREIAIVTKHHKETVISPILKTLGLTPIVADIDTDILGTFTGEIERKLSPYEAAIKKCEIGLDKTGLDIAIASEGSFGPHPSLYFIPGNEEMVVMFDRKNDIILFGKELSTETNFNGAKITSEKELINFLDKIEFPEHAVIVKDKKENFTLIKKGINELSILHHISNDLLVKHGEFWIETDMRAMYNPTRMKVIKKATENLIQKATSLCPSCSYPGFWITDTIPGLKCWNCNLPTKSTFAYLYKCKSCHFEEVKEFPHNKTKEDPMYCDFCNP